MKNLSLFLILATFACGTKVKPENATSDPLVSFPSIASVDAPSQRFLHQAVWTGSKMLVWGGHQATASASGKTNTGGLYDLATDKWSATSTTDAPAARASDFALVWTGSQALVFSGDVDGPPYADEAVWKFNPEQNTWEKVSATGGPITTRVKAVWADTMMIVLPFSKTGASAFNPATNLWKTLSDTGRPEIFASTKVIWTGGKVVVVGNGLWSSYDPATDLWTELAGFPGLYDFGLASNETTMVLFGKAKEQNYFGDSTVVVLDLASKTSKQSDTAAAAFDGADISAVWTGSKFVVYGDGPGKATGQSMLAEINPVSMTVESKKTVSLPSREFQSAVWTGTKFLIWGGKGGMNNLLNDGMIF